MTMDGMQRIGCQVHSRTATSAVFFGETVVLPLIGSCQGLVKTFLLLLISKRYNSPSSPPTSLSPLEVSIGAGPRLRLLMTVTMCADICAQSGNKCCCAVNSLSRSVGHMERRIASRMSLGNWSPVHSRCLRLELCARGH